MNKIITLIFLVFAYCTNAQQLALKIDSIVVYSLPMSMRTVISLDENAVRAFDTKIGSREILKVSSVNNKKKLDEFEAVNFANDSLIGDFPFSLDVRLVMDIYLEYNVTISISMDSSGYYRIQNEQYQRSRNSELIEWLKEFAEDLK